MFKICGSLHLQCYLCLTLNLDLWLSYDAIVTDDTAKVISFEDATGKKVEEGEEGESKKKERITVNKVHNVYGSSAGAGSGEFHTYRNLRRKEMFRVERMEREAAKEEKDVRGKICSTF